MSEVPHDDWTKRQPAAHSAWRRDDAVGGAELFVHSTCHDVPQHRTAVVTALFDDEFNPKRPTLGPEHKSYRPDVDYMSAGFNFISQCSMPRVLVTTRPIYEHLWSMCVRRSSPPPPGLAFVVTSDAFACFRDLHGLSAGEASASLAAREMAYREMAYRNSPAKQRPRPVSRTAIAVYMSKTGLAASCARLAFGHVSRHIERGCWVRAQYVSN